MSDPLANAKQAMHEAFLEMVKADTEADKLRACYPTPLKEFAAACRRARKAEQAYRRARDAWQYELLHGSHVSIVAQ